MFDIELASFTYSRAWHYSVIISCFPFLKIQIIVKDYYIIYHVTHPEFCVQCVCVQFCFIDQSDQGNEKKISYYITHALNMKDHVIEL